MPFLHRTAVALQQRGTTAAAVGPITLAYNRMVASGRLRPDSEQLSLSAALDGLYSSLLDESTSSFFAPSSPLSASVARSLSMRKRSFLIPDEHIETAAQYYASNGSLSSLMSSGNFAGMAMATANFLFAKNILSPKGIYVHGSVGVGKSMVMDLFHSICADGLIIPEENIKYNPIKRRLKRCHFHEFMLYVHQKIHAYKARHPKSDPIPSVAAAIAKEARLLCFDEMQVTDIADAMIMKRLFTILLDLGVVVVTTSNRPPSGLYEGGINRSVFLPFIDTLGERMTVIEMGGTHDYRRDGLVSKSDSDAAMYVLPSYICVGTNPSSQEVLEQWFSKGTGEIRSESVPVAMGRSVHVKRANDDCGWFSFAELCKQPLGAADYIAIANRFDIIIVDDAPQLGGNAYNEARRFVTFIDALYEARTKLILSADVPREDLFVGFDATVETNDGDEEIAIDDHTTDNNEESFVIGEGGSSSSSATTMIRTEKDGNMEWSATGRIGVSLAQLSAVREVSFSFKRAESRLAEMSWKNWGGRQGQD